MESYKGKYFSWILKDSMDNNIEKDDLRNLNINSLINNEDLFHNKDIMFHFQISRTDKDMFDLDWIQKFTYHNGKLYLSSVGYCIEIEFHQAEEFLYNLIKNSDIFSEKSVINLINYNVNL